MRRQLRTVLAANLNGDSAHDIAHAERVWNNAQAIAKGENYSADNAMMAACYLHDLVSLPKDHPDRKASSQLAAKTAFPILKALKFDEQQQTQICHAIAAHSFSANIKPTTDMAKIVQDADRLEALGAIGLARVFAVSGALGRPLFHGEDAFAQNREIDDSQYALDHFPSKLLKLPDSFQTKTGRMMANERANILRRYLADLAHELGQPPPNW